MRRASTVLLSLVLLIGGASTALAPAASAADVFNACEFAGNLVPPVEDDCKATFGFVNDTVDRQADNVFFVFCTVFPHHPACP